MKRNQEFVVLERDAVIHRTCSVGSQIVGRLNVGEKITPQKSARQGQNNPSTILHIVKWYTIPLPDGSRGYILGEESSKRPGEPGFIPEPAHYLREHLQIKVAHQDACNYRAVGLISREITWIPANKFFAWDIIRPKTGWEKFSIACPHCDKMFTADIYSTALLSEYRESYAKRSKKRKIVTAAVWLSIPAVIFVIAAIFPFSGVVKFIASVFVFLAGCIYEMFVDTSDIDNQITSQQIGGKASVWVTNTISLSNQDTHYIEWIKSF